MISLTNHDFQWGRSEVVIIYPDICIFPVMIDLPNEEFTKEMSKYRQATNAVSQHRHWLNALVLPHLLSWFPVLAGKYIIYIYIYKCFPKSTTSQFMSVIWAAVFPLCVTCLLDTPPQFHPMAPTGHTRWKKLPAANTSIRRAVVSS